MENCSRRGVDDPIDVQVLGRAVGNFPAPKPAESLGKKVAIIGGGPAGMNVAWQLALAGVEAHIFEKDRMIGGKLAQVIPWERLSQAIWDVEIKRFLAMPNIKVNLNVDMDKEKFDRLQQDYDYVVIAVGTHEPRRIAFPGHERVVTALDFLKKAKGKTPLSVGRGGRHRGRQCRLRRGLRGIPTGGGKGDSRRYPETTGLRQGKRGGRGTRRGVPLAGNDQGSD